MASNYAGNNSRNYPNAFLNNYVKWNSQCIEFPVPHTKSKWVKVTVKVGIDDKSTKQEIRVLVTSIEHLTISYDNTYYLCNKLHV